MTTETLQTLANLFNVEPFAVIVAVNDGPDHSDQDVYVEYNGVVTKMASFYLPSDALSYAAELKNRQPTWTVCTVRRLKDQTIVTRA